MCFGCAVICRKRNDLIDTQWNVNKNKLGIGANAYTDLIDTQWNVNKYPNSLLSRVKNDLIDTQWNVNVYDGFFCYLIYVGFNRYIVECKYYYQKAIYHIFLDLIDTQWNVNISEPMSLVYVDGFNRYIVECKLYCSAFLLRWQLLI